LPASTIVERALKELQMDPSATDTPQPQQVSLLLSATLFLLSQASMHYLCVGRARMVIEQLTMMVHSREFAYIDSLR
jgi:hypothetical protein